MRFLLLEQKSSMSNFWLRSNNIVFPDEIFPGLLGLRDGTIQEIKKGEHPLPVEEDSLDCGNLVVMPGLVDAHVHINEPGRTHWEGWLTGTAGAFQGGVTTLVEMPLNSIPSTVDLDSLNKKTASMQGKLAVDVGLWGGVVPSNLGQLKELYQAGILGFKCFLSDPGTAEFQELSSQELEQAMKTIAELGSVLLVHAELPSELSIPEGDPQEYSTYLASRPEKAEVEAIRLLIDQVRATECRVHIVHVASAEALSVIREAKAEGLPITAETCPHYLYFSQEDIAKGATAFKCAPPIRESSVRDALWEAVLDGTIDTIGSDHSPCPTTLKRLDTGNFIEAWGGIASLQYLLPATWTKGRERGLSLVQLAQLLAERPAVLAGLTDRGSIQVGSLADLILFDPETVWVASVENWNHAHALSPYFGETLTGKIQGVIQKGRYYSSFGQETIPREGRWVKRSGV